MTTRNFIHRKSFFVIKMKLCDMERTFCQQTFHFIKLKKAIFLFFPDKLIFNANVKVQFSIKLRLVVVVYCNKSSRAIRHNQSHVSEKAFFSRAKCLTQPYQVFLSYIICKRVAFIFRGFI